MSQPIALTIIDGPERKDLYHESEFCHDGNSGPIYRSIFRVQKGPCEFYALSACVDGVTHAKGVKDRAHNFEIEGTIYLPQARSYSFSATYSTRDHSGTMELKAPPSILQHLNPQSAPPDR